jgi:SAM-dependent methyltransferase
MNPYLKQFLEGVKPGKALDFGCGPREDVDYLNSNGWDVVGLDLPETDLNNNYLHESEVDLVYSNYVLPFIKDKQKFADNFYNNLKDDGLFFLATFQEEDMVLGDMAMPEEDLRKLFGKFYNLKTEKHEVWEEEHQHFHKLLTLTGKKLGG